MSSSHDADASTDRVFRHGFILTSHSSRFTTQVSGNPIRNLSKWQKTCFGPWVFWHDQRLNCAKVDTDAFSVAFMGIGINPFDGAADNPKIARILHQKLLISERAFFDYIDQITGNHIIFYRIGQSVRVLQDASGSKPVFYHFNADGSFAVASHAAILAEAYNLERNTEALDLINHPTYRSDPSRYLPGLLTPFREVYPLTANNLLDVDKKQTRRFFPREAILFSPLTPILINEVADIFTEQARLLSSTRDVAIATSAGKDSRLSLAAFRSISERSFCFTFHRASTGHLTKDVVIADRLAKAKGFRHLVADLADYEPDSAFSKAFNKHSPIGIWPSAARFYCLEFADDVVSVRSTVSEIGRCFYSHRRNRVLSASLLASAYTKSDIHNDPKLIRIFEEYINNTYFKSELFYNYDFYDMFYWEHRNSKWQNVLCSEAEMASSVFIPYNNREILKRFLSIPEEERRSASLHAAVTHVLAPEFDDIALDSAV